MEYLNPNEISKPQDLDNGSVIEYGFSGQPLLIETHKEVWTPTVFTLGLCEILSNEDFTGKTVMEMGSGSGAPSIVVGQRGANVIATDLNQTALQMTRANWKRNGLDSSKLRTVHSNTFDYFLENELNLKVDLLISNPPTAPEKQGNSNNTKTATQWNENGYDGRLVADATIFTGKQFAKESLIILTSKQGSLTSFKNLTKAYGEGIVNKNSDDPLNYEDDETQDFNWKVVKRVDVVLADWYGPFLDTYRDLNATRGDLPPVYTNELGQLYQRLYFIRAKNNA